MIPSFFPNSLSSSPALDEETEELRANLLSFSPPQIPHCEGPQSCALSRRQPKTSPAVGFPPFLRSGSRRKTIAIPEGSFFFFLSPLIRCTAGIETLTTSDLTFAVRVPFFPSFFLRFEFT